MTIPGAEELRKLCVDIIDDIKLCGSSAHVLVQDIAVVVDALLQRLDAEAAAKRGGDVPEGYVLVPRVPTVEMHKEFYRSHFSQERKDYQRFSEDYAEMIYADYVSAWEQAMEYGARMAYERAARVCDEYADRNCDGLALEAANQCVRRIRSLSQSELEAPAPVTVDGWISVAEKLPASESVVMCYPIREDGPVTTFRNGKWIRFDHNGYEYEVRPTHWTPLLDAPKVEG